MSIRYWNISAAWLIAVASFSHPAHAGVFQDGDIIMLQAAPGAYHYNSSPEHKGNGWLIGVEWQSQSRWLAGAAYFSNSFGQKCEYLYGGKSWPIGTSGLYAKLTGGVLLGYKDPFEDKIPFNNNGVAPGIIPAVGYKMQNFNVQLNVLGTAGLMLTVGYDLFK